MSAPSPAVKLLCCSLGGGWINWSSPIPMPVITPAQEICLYDDLVAVVEVQLLLQHTLEWYRGIVSSQLWMMIQMTVPWIGPIFDNKFGQKSGVMLFNHELCYKPSWHTDWGVLIPRENIHPVWWNLTLSYSTSTLKATSYGLLYFPGVMV